MCQEHSRFPCCVYERQSGISQKFPGFTTESKRRTQCSRNALYEAKSSIWFSCSPTRICEALSASGTVFFYETGSVDENEGMIRNLQLLVQWPKMGQVPVIGLLRESRGVTNARSGF